MEQAAKPKRARKPKAGDVFAMPLGDGTFGFCQMCKDYSYAYFDVRGESLLAVDEVLACPVAFRVLTMESAAKDGQWVLLGNQEPKDALAERQLLWNQPVGSNQVYLYKNDQYFPVNREEVKELEIFASWYHQHIVQRLLDHFNGRMDGIAAQMNRFKNYDPQTGQEIKD